MTSPQDALNALCEILSRSALEYDDEYKCQNQVEDLLKKYNIQYERERRLIKGRVDFYFPKSRIGLELKCNNNWNKVKVYRQCEMYCEDPSIQGLILATGHAQSLPSTINNKVVKVHLLGLGML